VTSVWTNDLVLHVRDRIGQLFVRAAGGLGALPPLP
jgi:hypothetical protein